MRLLLPTIVALVGIGTSACHRPASVEELPAKAPPASARASSSSAPGVLDASSAEASLADAAAPPSDPCVVAVRAERDDLRSCYLDTAPAPKWDVTSLVEITVSPAEVKTAEVKTTPGGIGDLVVHYANRSDAPVVLLFDDSPSRGHVVAHHASGRRADGVETPPSPAWAKSTRRYQRVTLAPKAVLDERKMWFASSWRWQRNSNQKEWPRSMLGPLPKGTYVLRVRTPLVTRSEGDRVDYAEGSTSGRVE